MAEKQNTPEIRFEGFTDPWEQRKLGDVSKNVTPKNTDGALNETFTTSAERGIVSQLDYFDHDITNEANVNGYYVVRSNDFVYNPRISTIAPCGPINRNRLNRAGVMSPLYTVFSIGDGVCKTYLEHYFKTSRWHDFMFLEGNTGARSDRFSISDSLFFEMPIWCPSLAEQEAIAQQLELTDNLITLHQRKYDKLCTVKKSMLDKMFPKPGETEPEIRFEGFTDPWEQRKLGELLLFQNGFNGSSESFGSGIPLISVMDVLDDEFITHETVRGKARLNCEEASRYCVEYGDVLFQRSSENQEDAGTSNVYLDQHVSSAFGGFVIRGKKVGEYNPIFIKYLLGSSFIREQITHRAQGAQHINVSQDTLADVVLLMPSMREQEAVGLVFLHLDNLITLHQRKLELLRNIKKSLLDRMFV